jgi:hypothetical protein
MKKKKNMIAPYCPDFEYTCVCDEKGKTWEGAKVFKKLVWEVRTPDGGEFTVDDQEHAEMLAILYDVQKRLKRLEKAKMK